MGSITVGVTASLSTSTIATGSPAILTLTASSCATVCATLDAYRIVVQGSAGSINRVVVAPLLVTLAPPPPGATITLGNVNVPVTGAPVTIVPALAPGDTLTIGGCVVPAGVSVNASAQLVSITASPQAGSSGMLTCGTATGRTVRAQLVIGYDETVQVWARQQSGATFDVNVQTQGFSEVDSVLLVGTDGTFEEDDGEEDNGDVTEDFETSIPAGQCVRYSAYVWGYTEGADTGGPAWASGSDGACDEEEAPPPPAPTLNVTADGVSLSIPNPACAGNVDTVCISPAPAMQNVLAWLTPAPGTTLSGHVSWQVVFEYDKAGSWDWLCTVPTVHYVLPATAQWNITAAMSGICGGQATLTYTCAGSTQSFPFTVLGENPSADTERNALGSNPWFLRQLVNHETGYAQFRTTGYKGICNASQ